MIIKLLALLLIVVSAYFGWWAISAASFWWLVPSAFALVASFGLFRGEPWAQYLWHVIALVATASWLVSVVDVALSGWPYDNVLESGISLIPGLLLASVCAGGSAAVAKYYRGQKNAL